MEKDSKIKKHHYRAVFKSEHLGQADLEDMLEEGAKLIFTIDRVRQEMNVAVAGKRGSFNIAYFVEPIKPLVLNATNSKVVKAFAGGSPFVEDWVNIRVELYIDPNVKMKNEVVGGVRIKNIAPNAGLPILTKDMPAYSKVVDHIKNGGLIEDIRVKYVVSDELAKTILNDAIS